MTIIHTILILLGGYLSIYVVYHLALLAAHFFIRESEASEAAPSARFALIIPAHNEELLLERLLTSAFAQQYPAGLFDIFVVADNCTDRTDAVAFAQGAEVLMRTSQTELGKGYAIQHALDRIDLKRFDAVLIVDADSVMSDSVLIHLDRLLCTGQSVIQCYNGVFNADENWFTRLLDVSRTMANEIFHPAKQKLGFSSYLMGNGMCFSADILSRYEWSAFTVGEDWEYYAKLIRDGGHVAFSNKARIYHQESISLRQATTQRMRWSSGRFAVAWQYGLGLFFRGIVEGNLVKVDAAFPLVLPNPSLGMNLTVIGFIFSLVIPASRGNWIFPAWFAALAMSQLGIFITGIFYTERKLKNFLSIFIAPLFLIWKMGIDILSVFGFGRKRWIRTERRM